MKKLLFPLFVIISLTAQGQTFNVDVGIGFSKYSATYKAGALDGQTEAGGIIGDVISTVEDAISSTGVLNEERNIDKFSPMILASVSLFQNEGLVVPTIGFAVGGRKKFLIKTLFEASLKYYPLRHTDMGGNFDLSRLVFVSAGMEYDTSFRDGLSGKDAIMLSIGSEIAAGAVNAFVQADLDVTYGKEKTNHSGLRMGLKADLFDVIEKVKR